MHNVCITLLQTKTIYILFFKNLYIYLIFSLYLRVILNFYKFLIILLLSNLGNARGIIEAVLLIEKITPICIFYLFYDNLDYPQI